MRHRAFEFVVLSIYCMMTAERYLEGEKNGGGAGTRTPDTGIMIPLLYQLSYTAPGKF
jgi:hypothetical protein